MIWTVQFYRGRELTHEWFIGSDAEANARAFAMEVDAVEVFAQ